MANTYSAAGASSCIPCIRGNESPAGADSCTIIPTDAPVVVPTDAPVVVPTDAPVVVPTDAPVVVPTDAQVEFPTEKDEPEVVPTEPG